MSDMRTVLAVVAEMEGPSMGADSQQVEDWAERLRAATTTDDPTFMPPDDMLDGMESMHDDALVDLLRLFREVAAAWATFGALVEAEVARRNPAGQHTTTDGHAFTVRKGAAKYQWDSERLWGVVVARALDERRIDPDTGEVLESEADCVARVLRSVLGKHPNWTTTGLSELGIEANDYREREGSRLSVQT